MKITYEEVCLKLKGQIKITNEKEIQNGRQLRLDNGCVINCYNNGNANVQGNIQNIEYTNQVLGSQTDTKTRKIFVVYGHDDNAKTQLEAMLRRWELEPIILDQQASGGNTIIEKLEEYSKDIGYAIVLATPDDVGRSKKGKDDKSRVRQNVVLELGMFLSKLGRERVAILLKEAENFEKPSDIQGLVYIPFKDNVEEVRPNLLKELDRQGYNIKQSKI